MFSQDEYLKVLDYAVSAHKEEKDNKNNVDIVHVTSVAMEIINACEKSKLDEEKANLAISCALLHNIIDDTKKSYDDLYVDFSDSIANGVEALSINKSLDTKQEQLRNSIEMLLEQPYEVQMVKLADIIINISTANMFKNNNDKKAYIKEASFILSCLKNSNIYLSNRLEEKIQTYKNL